MDKSDAILKDKILRITIDGKGSGIFKIGHISKPLKLDVSKAVLLCEELENDGMLSRSPSSKEHSFRKDDAFDINPKGEDFLLNKGGFTKLYNDNLIASRKRLENEAIEEKKLRDDAKLSRWQVKTRWWPLIISVSSFLLSIWALFRSTSYYSYVKDIIRITFSYHSSSS